MSKKKDEGKYDELFPDEDAGKILKSSDMANLKEDIPKKEEVPIPQPIEPKEQIKNLLNSAITLMNRNLRNKERAFKNIMEAIEIVDKL